jgi:hypothetical protein
VGVWIERAGHEAGIDPPPSWYTSYRLYFAEQPPPYTGDIYEARIRLHPNPADPTRWDAYYQPNPADPFTNCCASLPASFQLASSSLDPRLAMALPGDMIRFNGRGPYYVVEQILPDRLTFRASLVQSESLMKFARIDPAPLTPAFQPGVRFEIVRRPIKSSSTPLELPRNTAIDLSLSGYGYPYSSPYNALWGENPYIYPPAFFANNYPQIVAQYPQAAARFREIHPEYDIVVMFKPDGGVDRVHYVGHELDMASFWEVPQGTISLLVCRDDQIGRDSLRNLNVTPTHVDNVHGPLGEANLRDQDNLWLSVSTISGRIQSAPNGDAFVDATTGAPLLNLPLTPASDARIFLRNARRFASTGQTLGGQ